jgi:hypothetical protein
MIGRKLIVFGLVVAGHWVVSGIGLIMAVGAGMSPGSQWLIPLVICSLFLPALAAGALGLDLEPANLWVALLGLLVNSLCWAMVVCPAWMFTRRVLGAIKTSFAGR